MNRAPGVALIAAPGEHFQTLQQEAADDRHRPQALGISKTYPGVRALDAVDLEVAWPAKCMRCLARTARARARCSALPAARSRPMAASSKSAASSSPPPIRSGASLGLATVYQDDLLIRELSVAQNLYLGSMDPHLTYGASAEWARCNCATMTWHLPVGHGGRTDARRTPVPGNRQGADRQAEGAAAGRADLDAGPRRRAQAGLDHPRLAAPGPPSSMSATGCRRSSNSPTA